WPALWLHAASEGYAVDGEVESAQRADPDWHRARQTQSRFAGMVLDAVCRSIRCARPLSRLHQTLGQHAPRPGGTPGRSPVLGEGQNLAEQVAGSGNVTVLKQNEDGAR